MPKPKGQLVPPHVQRNLPYEPAEWNRWSRGDIGELTHLLRCYEPCVSIDSGEAYTKQAIQVAMCLCRTGPDFWFDQVKSFHEMAQQKWNHIVKRAGKSLIGVIRHDDAINWSTDHLGFTDLIDAMATARKYWYNPFATTVVLRQGGKERFSVCLTEWGKDNCLKPPRQYHADGHVKALLSRVQRILIKPNHGVSETVSRKMEFQTGTEAGAVHRLVTKEMLALLKPLSHSTKRRNEHSIRATDLDPNREGRAAIHFASLGGLASGDTLKDYGPTKICS